MYIKRWIAEDIHCKKSLNQIRSLVSIWRNLYAVIPRQNVDRSHDNSVDPGGRIRKKFNIRVKGYEVIFAIKFFFFCGKHYTVSFVFAHPFFFVFFWLIIISMIQQILQKKFPTFRARQLENLRFK